LKEIFNNREIATLIWLGILFLYLVVLKNFWKSFKNVLKAFFNDKIISLVLISIIYIEIIILILAILSFWDFSLIKGTLFWYIGVGFITMLNLPKATEGIDFFKSTLIQNLKFIILFEFIVNVYSFNLIAEFILLPILTLFVLIDTYAGFNEDTKKIKPITNGVLSVFGFILLIYSINQIRLDYSSFIKISNLIDFLLPVILTICFIPFLYFTALYMKYENLFVRIGFRFENDELQFKFIKKKIFRTCYFNLIKLNRLSKIPRINTIMSKDDLIKTIIELKTPVANTS